MKNANYASVWASQHPRQAAPLIILLEFANVVIGIMVGSAFLKSENERNAAMGGLS